MRPLFQRTAMSIKTEGKLAEEAPGSQHCLAEEKEADGLK